MSRNVPVHHEQQSMRDQHAIQCCVSFVWPLEKATTTTTTTEEQRRITTISNRRVCLEFFSIEHKVGKIVYLLIVEKNDRFFSQHIVVFMIVTE
jgi:hypothetical protein